MAIQFFLAGIIQGSRRDEGVHDQAYRKRIQALLERSFPEASVYCPVSAHPDSVSYHDTKARQVFLSHLALVRHSQALIVFLPEASMGSAIEMWEAHRVGVPVVTITPMRHNWVVRLFSDVCLEDLEAFEAFVSQGELHRLIQHRMNQTQGMPVYSQGQNTAHRKDRS